jgi:undecaprenyl-diphosphatase
MFSLAVTSAIANLPGKFLTRRTRPVIDVVPQARRLARVPLSSSFPSGHTASAFAFATAASLEVPQLAVPLGITAAAVGASRVYTGVHYPGDVLAGAALGTGIALAGRSFWPVAPHEPPQARTAFTETDADPSPTGKGLTVAVNLDAGPKWGDDPAEELRTQLPDAKVVEVEIATGDELRKALDDAADNALAIGVSGGDGSINTAAQVAVDNGKALMVVPGGTLNHLARDLGLGSVEDAAKAIKSGHTIAMDVATIDGLVFLNTASFGSYVELVDAREDLERRIGKWPAVLVALFRVLRHSKPVDVEIDGKRMSIWLAFIGNCEYHPSGFAPSWRERLDDGQLDIRVVNGSDPWARLRLIVSVLTGKLGNSRVYKQFLANEVHVKSLQGPLRLARDGETFEGSVDFYIRKHPEPLAVYVPRAEEVSVSPGPE